MQGARKALVAQGAREAPCAAHTHTIAVAIMVSAALCGLSSGTGADTGLSSGARADTGLFSGAGVDVCVTQTHLSPFHTAG